MLVAKKVRYTIYGTLDSLIGSKWFSILDSKSGYCYVEVLAEDKEKTLMQNVFLGVA